MTLSCFVQVLFNLANQYGNNDMYTEALNTYQVIVKNKMFNNAGERISNVFYLRFTPHWYKCVSNIRVCITAYPTIGRLKVNMANIYFKQKNYTKAIKFYRMALDQILNAHNAMRSVLVDARVVWTA